MLPPGANFELKIRQSAFVVGTLPRTPLRELTVLHRPSSWFSGDLFVAGEERRGEQWEGGKRDEKGAFPTSFFYNLTTV